MTIETYTQLQKLIALELNVHEVREVVWETEEGTLSLCFHTSLGYTSEPDSLFLKLGERRIENPALIQAIIAQKTGDTERYKKA